MKSEYTVYEIQDSSFMVMETEDAKVIRSQEYNYDFDKQNGNFARWGSEEGEEAQLSPVGPELLDMEISIGGCTGGRTAEDGESLCSWCYKANQEADEHHMNLDTAEHILDVIPESLTQVAFGITDADANPHFSDMIRQCWDKYGVVPNYTTSGYGMTEELFDLTAEYCGAVAVSVYPHNINKAYNTIREFTLRDMDQVNIHLMISQETLEHCHKVMLHLEKDPRLENVNSVVLLGLKPKGRASEGFSPLTTEQFENFFNYCMDNEYPIGFDSCSAHKFLSTVDKYIEDKQQKEFYHMVAEPCESGLFSLYINAYGKVFPCSFTEGEEGWENGLDMLDIEDEEQFIDDIWYHPRMVEWREKLLNNDRYCPTFPEIN